MPRPKIVERRRCLKACDSCKKRKEKCDGLEPCNVCKKRSREVTCTFLAPGNGRRASTSQNGPVRSIRQDSTTNQEPDLIFDLQSDLSRDIDLEERSPEGLNELGSPTSAPVPRLSRLLKDGKGGRIYIGDSASLSFLQTIRRMVSASVGICSFTADDMRPSLIEKTSDIQGQCLRNTEPVIANSDVLELGRQFFLATAGALDLFEPVSTMQSLRMWIEHPSKIDQPDCPMFFLLLAIGAQARAQDPLDEHIARYYFEHGQQQTKNRLLDDLSVLTVQAHCLITWYLITACRSNRATIELGIAAQAAFALGIHKSEVNAVLGKAESVSREKAWKTLRVCDLFLAASMGRPSITSNIDGNGPLVSSSTPKEIDNAGFDDRMASGMARICYLFERILSEVYPKRAVSLELAASISKQHREWTLALPEMLKIDGLSQNEQHTAADLTPFLGSNIVIMAYYYSIILLTRPFLTFKVQWRIKTRTDSNEEAEKSPDVITYSDACVDSALKGIEIAHDVLRYDGMPRRIPLIINSVFISALSLGLAFFGDYDSGGWALDRGLTQAVAVMRHFSLNNPQAARYQQIIEHLWSAASQYKCLRDDSKSSSRSRIVRVVFGNALSQVEGQRPASIQPKPLSDSLQQSCIPVSASGYDQALLDETDLLPLNYFDNMLQSSMITTSGGLLSLNDIGSAYHGVISNGPTKTYLSGDSSLLSQSFPFQDEGSLFSVVSDLHAHAQNDWHNLNPSILEA